jgi:glycosyltransferase involved in cell wall biosynthesis
VRVAARELVLVMPAFDEAALIEASVVDWHDELAALGLDFEIRVYDDGSRDATPEILARLAATLPRLAVRRHDNRGHGPSLLAGYREADGEWVAQADADSEIPVAAFPQLWARRERADFVLGRREGRSQSPARRLFSAFARLAVRALAGGGAADVNVPFRLMRRTGLVRLLRALPDDLFAPNVALTALALAEGLRVVEVPVPFVPQRSEPPARVSARLARGAARSLFETVAVVLRGAPGA